ncbi:MAG: RHS repeat protein [Pseudomonadales bacterium]|nr:MAG: RHS repeat protein [Pseudomonadales bacterium]
MNRANGIPAPRTGVALKRAEVKLASIAVLMAAILLCATVALALCTLVPPANAGQAAQAMSALIGAERFLLGESTPTPEQRVNWDIAPNGGDGQLNWADVSHIQQRLLNGVPLLNALQAVPLRQDSVATRHEYTWHGEAGRSPLASHTESLQYPGKPVALQRFYDRRGNLIKTVNAAGLVTRLENYNANGQPQSITEINGTVTKLQYHPRGWLLRSTLEHPDNSANNLTTSYRYDDTGKLNRVVFPSGRYIDYLHDARGELVAMRDAGGQQINYQLDAAGNRVVESLCTRTELASEVDISPVTDIGCIEHFRLLRLHDGNNRLRRNIDGRGARSNFEYDDNGRLLSIENASGHKDQTAYNALEQLISLAHVPAQDTPPSGQAASEPVAFHYRTDDALLGIDAPGDSTDYLVDAYSSVVQSSSEAHGVSQFGFDVAGNQVTAVDAEGRQQVFHYDALNRLVRVQVPGEPDAQIDYLFGAQGVDAHAAGRLVYIRDGSGSIQHTYDFAGRLARRNIQIGDQEYPIKYFYDADGQLTGVDYPGIRELRYTLNASGEVREIRLDDQLLATEISYLPFGPPRSVSLANGITRKSIYALDYTLTAVEDIGVNFRATQSFNFDAVGNLLTLSRTGVAPEQWHFAYDSKSRLTHASDASGSINFAYDSAGNRLSRKRLDSDGAAVELNTYAYADNGNRLSSVQSSIGGSGQLAFGYDASGKLLSRSGAGNANVELVYNGFGRVKTAIVANEVVARFSYNALGQRVSKLTDGALWHFIYDETGRLLGRIDILGAQSIWYVYLQDQRIARIIGANGDTAVEFYHNDHLGRPWALSNASGELVWQASYAPFGNRTVKVENTLPQWLGLPGQLYDRESGFWYNYQRDYDSDSGRYLQGDPLGVQGGLNTYMYAGANPLRFTDPYGLFFFGPVCGSGASARFVPDGRFTDACQKHDDCYGGCGNSKEQCDLNLCTDGACLYGFMLSTVFSGASGNAFDDAQKGCDDCE